MARKKSTVTAAARRTWLVRIAVALAVGVTLGAGGGAAAVSRLEPGRPGQTDSLQTMLDSLRKDSKAKSASQAARATEAPPAPEPVEQIVDEATQNISVDQDAPEVPDIVGMGEGPARDALELVGLTVGTIQFRNARKAPGTVLAATPAARSRVRLGTAINLVLSDGRTPVDTGADPMSSVTRDR